MSAAHTRETEHFSVLIPSKLLSDFSCLFIVGQRDNMCRTQPADCFPLLCKLTAAGSLSCEIDLARLNNMKKFCVRKSVWLMPVFALMVLPATGGLWRAPEKLKNLDQPPKNALFQSSVADGIPDVVDTDRKLVLAGKTEIFQDKTYGRGVRLRSGVRGTAYVYVPVHIPQGSVPTYMQLWGLGSKSARVEAALFLVSGEGAVRKVANVGPICQPHPTPEEKNLPNPPFAEAELEKLDKRQLTESSFFIAVALIRDKRPLKSAGKGAPVDTLPQAINVSLTDFSVPNACECTPPPTPCPTPHPASVFGAGLHNP